MDSMLIVNLSKAGTIRLDCDLQSFDEKKAASVSLIYDTGADKTSITREALELLGYSKFKCSGVKKRTATGTFMPRTCTVSRLVVGNQFSLANMTVDVLENSSSPNFDGVLGMDFILMVESVISGSKRTLEITKAL